MKKIWWFVFLAALIGVLLLAPDSKVSYTFRDLFYQLQDSLLAWLDQSPEKWWQVVGPAIPLVALAAVVWGYLRVKSKRLREILIRAFVPLLTASLTLYGTLILDVGGWAR